MRTGTEELSRRRRSIAIGVTTRPDAVVGAFLSVTRVCRDGQNRGRAARGGAASVDDGTDDIRPLGGERGTREARSRLRPVNCWQSIAKRMRCSCIGNTSRELPPLPRMPTCSWANCISSWEIQTDGLRSLHHALEIQPTVRGAHTYRGNTGAETGRPESGRE